MPSVLIISKDEEILPKVRSCLGSDSQVRQVSGENGALDILRKNRFDFVLLDARNLRESAASKGYREALIPFYDLYPTLDIIIMTPPELIREAVKMIREGASDYISYPINTDEMKHVMEDISETRILESEVGYLRDQFWQSDSLDIIQTQNAAMKEVYHKVRSVAPTKSTVLLIGETGTGKGVLANLIHRHSNRKDASFIPVHCGSIPDTLLESELFGHEKGAFTGAIKRKLGKFEIAHVGTIFLDEIGTMTPSAQIKLLQVLQDGTFQRVGGEATLQANVRVIAATNMEIKKMCENGQFRTDLYYRLNVFPIQIPPLRERLEDIPHITRVFLRKMNLTGTKSIQDIDPQVLKAFQKYPWPGNIRELENLMERAHILETSHVLGPESFPADLMEHSLPQPKGALDACQTLAEVRATGIENIERQYLTEVLSMNKGIIKDTAKFAGITTRQLHKLMAKYGIRKEAYK
jgi:DNA-binding NtrC family response regulator